MAAPPSITYDWVDPSELDSAIAIEHAGFPPDEAATLDGFRYRQRIAPRLFLGAYTAPAGADGAAPPALGARTLVGYVCATRAAGAQLTHASMGAHDPAGESVCVHSVCVAREHEKRGVGSALLREYVARVWADAPSEGYKRVLLIAHEELRAWYESVGLVCAGPSAVQHGARPWVEMRLELGGDAGQAVAPAPAAEAKADADTVQQQPSQADVFAALMRASSRARPSGRPLAAFGGGVSDVVDADERNAHDLLCPRAGCGSVVLKAGAVALVEGASLQLEPAPHAALPPFPPAGESTYWWHVPGGAMAFENVGFTRPPPDAPGRKLLACAECDVGPIGWADVAGRGECWVWPGRVSYRAD